MTIDDILAAPDRWLSHYVKWWGFRDFHEEAEAMLYDGTPLTRSKFSILMWKAVLSGLIIGVTVMVPECLFVVAFMLTLAFPTTMTIVGLVLAYGWLNLRISRNS